MLISVCLPVKNGEEFLAESIESILNQTHEQFELLIAHDSSADRSAEIIAGYARQDKRVLHWRTSAKGGLHAVYNECFRRAAGTFIKPFAQSAIMHPSMLEELAGHLRENATIAMVGCRVSFPRNEETPDTLLHGNHAEPEGIVYTNRFLSLSEIIALNLPSLANFVDSLSSVLFRSASIGDGFDLKLKHYRELDYWLRILIDGCLWVSKDILCEDRVEPVSTRMSTIDLSRFSELITLSRKSGWFLQAFGHDEKRFLENAISCLAAQLDNSEKQQFRSASQPKEDEAEQLRVFQELFCHSINLIHRHSTKAPDTDPTVKQRMRNEFTIKVLERRLTSLLRSPSWKMTKNLRDLNRLIVDEKFAGPMYSIDSDYETLTNEQQRRYIQWLRRQIASIKTSRSWKLSYPLRFLETASKKVTPSYGHRI